MQAQAAVPQAAHGRPMGGGSETKGKGRGFVLLNVWPFVLCMAAATTGVKESVNKTEEPSPQVRRGTDPSSPGLPVCLTILRYQAAACAFLTLDIGLLFFCAKTQALSTTVYQAQKEKPSPKGLTATSRQYCVQWYFAVVVSALSQCCACFMWLVQDRVPAVAGLANVVLKPPAMSIALRRTTVAAILRWLPGVQNFSVFTLVHVAGLILSPENVGRDVVGRGVSSMTEARMMGLGIVPGAMIACGMAHSPLSTAARTGWSTILMSAFMYILQVYGVNEIMAADMAPLFGQLAVPLLLAAQVAFMGIAPPCVGALLYGAAPAPSPPPPAHAPTEQVPTTVERIRKLREEAKARACVPYKSPNPWQQASVSVKFHGVEYDDMTPTQRADMRAAVLARAPKGSLCWMGPGCCQVVLLFPPGAPPCLPEEAARTVLDAASEVRYDVGWGADVGATSVAVGEDLFDVAWGGGGDEPRLIPVATDAEAEEGGAVLPAIAGVFPRVLDASRGGWVEVSGRFLQPGDKALVLYAGPGAPGHLISESAEFPLLGPSAAVRVPLPAALPVGPLHVQIVRAGHASAAAAAHVSRAVLALSLGAEAAAEVNALLASCREPGEAEGLISDISIGVSGAPSAELVDWLAVRSSGALVAAVVSAGGVACCPPANVAVAVAARSLASVEALVAVCGCPAASDCSPGDCSPLHVAAIEPDIRFLAALLDGNGAAEAVEEAEVGPSPTPTELALEAGLIGHAKLLASSRKAGGARGGEEEREFTAWWAARQRPYVMAMALMFCLLNFTFLVAPDLVGNPTAAPRCRSLTWVRMHAGQYAAAWCFLGMRLLCAGGDAWFHRNRDAIAFVMWGLNGVIAPLVGAWHLCVPEKSQNTTDAAWDLAVPLVAAMAVLQQGLPIKARSLRWVVPVQVTAHAACVAGSYGPWARDLAGREVSLAALALKTGVLIIGGKLSVSLLSCVWEARDRQAFEHRREKKEV